MKSIVLLMTLVAAQAFAYSTNPLPIAFGKYSVFKTAGTELSQKTQVSLELQVVSKTSKKPNVQIHDRSRNSCSVKQILISYSGYDLKKAQYVTTYEIQVVRDLKKLCALVVHAENYRDVNDVARVDIL